MRFAKLKWLAVCGIAVIVSGCTDTREMLGLERTAPDEFTVFSRAPLSMPPDFNLKPPTPGAERPQEETQRSRAQTALFGRQNRAQPVQNPIASPATPGLQALLQETGALSANGAIRQQVDRETGAFIAEDERFTDDLLFWKDKQAFGTKIDAAQEAQRIREAQALGEEVDGTGAIIIERKEEALLEGIFN